MLTFGKEDTGIKLGIFGLLFSLTVVNLLVFYFDQFSTIILAIVQFNLLLGLFRYRKRFIFPHE